MPDSFLELIHEMVLTSDEPAKAVAEKLDKNYTTFMREVNPFDDGAKLGASMLLPLMVVCGSARPLEYLASRLGFRLVPLDQVKPDKSDLGDELLDTYPTIVALHDAIRHGDPIEDVGALFREAVLELEEDFVKYRNDKCVVKMNKAG